MGLIAVHAPSSASLRRAAPRAGQSVGRQAARAGPSVCQIPCDTHCADVHKMTPEIVAELPGSVGVWVERQLGARVGEVFFSRVSMSRGWGVLLGDAHTARPHQLGRILARLKR